MESLFRTGCIERQQNALENETCFFSYSQGPVDQEVYRPDGRSEA